MHPGTKAATSLVSLIVAVLFANIRYEPFSPDSCERGMVVILNPRSTSRSA
jgi:hypothetical protein